MNRLINIATRLWRVVTGGLMLAITLITLAQVFSRYILNTSLIWSEELNRLLYVWLLMLAAAGAQHMRIGLIADTPRFKSAFDRIAAIFGALTLGLVIYGGWKLQAMFAFDRYTTLDLSKTWYFAAAVVGGAIWAVAMLYRAFFREGGETN